MAKKRILWRKSEKRWRKKIHQLTYQRTQGLMASGDQRIRGLCHRLPRISDLSHSRVLGSCASESLRAMAASPPKDITRGPNIARSLAGECPLTPRARSLAGTEGHNLPCMLHGIPAGARSLAGTLACGYAGTLARWYEDTLAVTMVRSMDGTMVRGQLRKTTASVSNYIELGRAVCRSQIQAD